MLTDWLNFDLGDYWRGYSDKTLLAEEIRMAFLDLQKMFHRNKLSNYRYYNVITDWFHDGNRDCGWIMDYKNNSLPYKTDEKSLWIVLYRLFKYLQWSYAMMEVTNLLDKEK